MKPYWNSFHVGGVVSKKKIEHKRDLHMFSRNDPSNIRTNKLKPYTHSHNFLSIIKIQIGHSGRFAIGSLKIKIEHISSHTGEIRNQRVFCFNFFCCFFAFMTTRTEYIFFCHSWVTKKTNETFCI